MRISILKFERTHFSLYEGPRSKEKYVVTRLIKLNIWLDQSGNWSKWVDVVFFLQSAPHGWDTAEDRAVR